MIALAKVGAPGKLILAAELRDCRTQWVIRLDAVLQAVHAGSAS